MEPASCLPRYQAGLGHSAACAACLHHHLQQHIHLGARPRKKQQAQQAQQAHTRKRTCTLGALSSCGRTHPL